jgi:hypothetical protein
MYYVTIGLPLLIKMGLDRPAFESRWDKRIFSSQYRPERLWGSPNLLFNVYQGSFPEVKRPGREVDHSSLSSAEAMNECSYTSTRPPVCLHGVDRDNFTL